MKRFAVSLQGICAQGHAAGVGVFDDDARRCGKAFHTLPGRIGVGDVVVGQLFALQLHAHHQRAGGGVHIAVKRRELVWVFAIAQVLQFDKAAIRLPREHGELSIDLDARQVVADGAVVLADAVERGHGQCKAGGVAPAAVLAQLIHHRAVLRGVGEHRHMLPIFSGAAHHGRAANVDVLDRVFQCATRLGHRGFKGVQVDHQKVNGVYAVRLQSLHVRGQIAAGQQAPMHHGVQSFDAAIEHLGKAGDIGHLAHGQALVAQQLRGATGGDQAHAQSVQSMGEFGDAALIGDRNQCVHGGPGLAGPALAGSLAGGQSKQVVLGEFFAQGVAVQAQPLGGARLVVLGVLHHHFQQRLFHGTHHHVM